MTVVFKKTYVCPAVVPNPKLTTSSGVCSVLLDTLVDLDLSKYCTAVLFYALLKGNFQE